MNEENKDTIKLDKDDFEKFLSIEAMFLSCEKAIRDIVRQQASIEMIFHNFWTNVRIKYKLDITKKYSTDRQTGVITEIEGDSTIKVDRKFDAEIEENFSFEDLVNEIKREVLEDLKK